MREKIITALTAYRNGHWWEGINNVTTNEVDTTVKMYADKTDEELFDILMQEIDDRIESIY